MARITVKSKATNEGWELQVTVTEGGGSSSYSVRVPRSDYERLTAGKMSPEELGRRSFEFLLAREGKESILRSFEIRTIARYFPEYEREMKARIGQ